MRRLAALALLLSAVLVARRSMAGDVGADLRGTALAFGFAVIAAALTGGLIERLRLPRISGYLLFGLACGPYAADLISQTMAVDLQQINGLAIALIAFVAGLEMNLSRLRADLPRIARLGATVLAGSVLLFWAFFSLAWNWLPLPGIDTTPLRLAVSGVAALLVVSFSPTVTIAVIAESRARGPLTSLVVALVVLADLVLIVVFALALQAIRTLSASGAPAQVGLLALLSWELVGSLAFGAALGACFAFYLRLVGREVTIALLVLCILFAVVGRALHFEIILVALAAGLVVENVAAPTGDALKLAVERGALPVLVVFFASAGASIELDALAKVGGIALAIALARAVALYVTSVYGSRWAELSLGANRYAWMGLVSQGGVTLGLASLVAAEFADWGPPLYTLVIALTALHVLAGPILFRSALVKAGEVGRMDK